MFEIYVCALPRSFENFPLSLKVPRSYAMAAVSTEASATYIIVSGGYTTAGSLDSKAAILEVIKMQTGTDAPTPVPVIDSDE